MWKKSLWALGALLLLALAALSLYVWRSFPTLDGELPVQGLKAPVQVRRDAADVTHIEAASVADAFQALGYVHAQERSWQLEFNRRVMRGLLSEVFGAATLDTDRLLRTLGIMQAAQAQWERMDPADQALISAYARGINAFHAQSRQALPPEFHVLDVKPGEWTALDSMGWAIMMALDLGGNWGNEFARLSVLQHIGTPQLWQLMPAYPGEAPATSVDLAQLYRGMGLYKSASSAPAAATRTSALSGVPLTLAETLRGRLAADTVAWAQGLGHVEGKGSNNWVMAGNRTASGKPLLANDPHLGLSAPAIWYFARLKVPAAAGGQPLDAIGATLPGLPTVVLGRTGGVAWGFTNTGPDVQDLYIEQINPANPAQYRTPDGWADFQTREEVIKVKGQADEKLVVRSTRHGPVMSYTGTSQAEVIDTRKFVLALRWSALDADNQTVAAGIRANFAQTTEALLSAFSAYHSPMQNLVAADTTGRTAYKAIGRVPQRRADNDIRGMAPSPGWEARYDWQGWMAADQTPGVGHDAIAAKGWHATANQRIHAPDYPYFLGQDWSTPERYDRIEALLAARPRHTAESLAAIQADTVSLATQRLLPVLRATVSNHPLAAAAQTELKDFDGNMRPERAAPLIFAAWADELARGLIAPRITEPRFKSLYGKRHFRIGVEAILQDPAAGAYWCAPLSCADQSSQALGRALDRLSAQLGTSVGQWQWGQLHPAISAHRPFGNVPLLAKAFDVRVPTGGDPWTVNVGQYWPNQVDHPFGNRHAASLRAIYDLSDLEKSQFIYQTGQSGLVFSRRYRDMKDTWAQVGSRPLQLQPGSWAHTATLQPAP